MIKKDKELTKYIKNIYKRFNKFEKQYLLTRTDDQINHYDISRNGKKNYSETDKEKISNLKDNLTKVDSIYIVHNHPGIFSSPRPSSLDYKNQMYVEMCLNELGKNTEDYLIYSSKRGIYSFKNMKELTLGLKNRVSKKMRKMKNPFGGSSYKEICNGKETIADLAGHKREIVITQNKILISDAFSLKKLEQEIKNEKGNKVLIINSKSDEEQRFLFYKRIKQFDEIFFVRENQWKGTLGVIGEYDKFTRNKYTID